ncbi:MAG: hypothetical protein HY364_02470 [Candidatus Aenigmarchaeota archaeon]|nr:hypothetical protein [Candidatus Aenigmarchaeota archaeon]
MFFRKKKESNKVVPSEEIESLISQGMSDKDIIKKLKSEGYSYESIENAMLKAVKVGVDDSGVGQDSFDPALAAPVMQQPQEPPAIDDFSDMDMKNAEELSPEQIVEELIEGVVESKWKRFDEEIERMNMEINSIKESSKNARPPEGSSDGSQYDEKINAISAQVEDISTRVGGLEKAFKQFLPSLTRNIESLSAIIHEMKGKQQSEPKPYYQ